MLLDLIVRSVRPDTYTKLVINSDFSQARISTPRIKNLGQFRSSWLDSWLSHSSCDMYLSRYQNRIHALGFKIENVMCQSLFFIKLFQTGSYGQFLGLQLISNVVPSCQVVKLGRLSTFSPIKDSPDLTSGQYGYFLFCFFSL